MKKAQKTIEGAEGAELAQVKAGAPTIAAGPVNPTTPSPQPWAPDPIPWIPIFQIPIIRH